MQQMLVPEALPKPAFVTVAQFQQILGLIEKRHYPKNKQTVIQVALDEGFVQQDNNFQSKVAGSNPPSPPLALRLECFALHSPSVL